MAKTRVPAYWIQNRDLPQVCARHDVPSTYLEKRDFYTRTPPWLFVTILLAVLLFVLLALALRTTVKGALPACADCKRDRRRFKLWVGGSFAVTALVLVAGIGTGSDALAIVGALLLLPSLVLACMGDRFRVSGFVSKDKAWVELNRVGPGFARAIEEAIRASQPVTSPQLSPDGQWRWDGTQWVPAAQPGLNQE